MSDPPAALMGQSESPCCPVCMVYYVPGYAGPCQEFHASASDEQIADGTARRCPGVVSLDAAVQAQRKRAEGVEAALREVARITERGTDGFDDTTARASAWQVAKAALR